MTTVRLGHHSFSSLTQLSTRSKEGNEFLPVSSTNSHNCQRWLPSVEDGTVIRKGPSIPFWYSWERKAIAWIVFPKP